MTNEIDILNEIEDNESFTQSIIEFIDQLLDSQGINNWAFSVTLTDDERIAELNRQWRGKEGPTDVLTFVMDEGEPFPENEGLHAPGDIVISLPRVLEQAKEYNQSPEKELKRLLVHGILHLKGLTHEDYDWNKGMLKQQEEILKKMEDLQLLGWNHGLV